MSHGDGTPGVGAEDCITSARRFGGLSSGDPPVIVRLDVVSFPPALPHRLWWDVCWVDILLDVIGEGGKRDAGGMSEDNDRCFSMLVLEAFSTGVFQHQCITPH